MSNLIDKTYLDYEQYKTKVKQIEDRILKVPGMSKEYNSLQRKDSSTRRYFKNILRF